MNYRERTTVALAQRPPCGAVAIKLTRGWVAWLDVGDYYLVSGHCWFAASRGSCVYAARSIRGGTIYMHAVVLPGAGEVDHVAHHPELMVVDNRRCNLRPATTALNAANARKRRTQSAGPTSSQFKGVGFDQRRNKWRARITHNREKHIGRFATEEEAARAYDAEARRVVRRVCVDKLPRRRSGTTQRNGGLMPPLNPTTKGECRREKEK